VDITFDPAKNERNVAERGLPFSRVDRLDWSSALISEDVRADKVHVISLRKANSREVRLYEQEIESRTA
jgi:uncharacterized DUF497 family protein